jgi:hypothetical protein
LDLEIFDGLMLFSSLMPPSRVQPHPENLHSHHLRLFDHYSLSDLPHHPPEFAHPLIRFEGYAIYSARYAFFTC